jgi:hypothetical protein
MNNARNPEWVRHLFRYRHQTRHDARGVGHIDLDVIKTTAALALAELRPSAIAISRESTMLLPEQGVQRCLAKLNSMGVLHPRGAGWTTGAPATWQSYSLHAVDEPADIDRRVNEFIRGLEAMVADLARRQPRKRAVG